MIATRTPFRITFGGGGTDLPAFYEKHGGYILAAGIDKYMYVTLNVPRADHLVRLHYTQSETVARTEQLKHELAREALLRHGIHDTIEISSLADLPAGTGLGSSSCYLVGLLNAVRSHLSMDTSARELAEEACSIEIDTLHKPIGRQDPYMAAYGGLTELQISRDGSVDARPVPLSKAQAAELISKTHLYYTNVQRPAVEILDEERKALRAGLHGAEEALREMLAVGLEIGTAIKSGDFDAFGKLLHEHWTHKKRLSDKVQLEGVDELYEYARRTFGVLGGKIAGAGGGGFLMMYCPGDGAALTEFMQSKGMARLQYAAEYGGSSVLVQS
jgi:D-glycero-alpha-D-manno-heptose-7-phosphate kinase